MYLFFAEMVDNQYYSKTKSSAWSDRFESFFKNDACSFFQFEHTIKTYCIQLSFLIPKNHLFYYKNNYKDSFSIYFVGDIRFYNPDALFERIAHLYRTSVSDLLYLPFIYNLIIVDHIEDKISFFSDSYLCQPLYYHKINQSYCVANTLKAYIANSEFRPSWNRAEVMNVFLIGATLPENTLISEIKKIKSGEYIAFPQFTLRKIPLVAKEKNNALGVRDCVEIVHQLMIEALKKYTNQADVGLLFSGGMDSTLIAKLLHSTKTENAVNFLSFLVHENDMNKKNIMDAEKLLGIQTTFFDFQIDDIVSQQAMAVWHGESEILGVNSLNAVLEMQLGKKIAKSAIPWTTGAQLQAHLRMNVPLDNTLENKLKKLFNYAMVKEFELRILMGDAFSLREIKAFLLESTVGDISEQFLLSVYPAPLFRLQNRSSCFQSLNFFIGRDNALIDFINTVPAHILQQTVAHHGRMVTRLNHELLRKTLGDFYETPRKKSWMESFVFSGNHKINLDRIKEIVLSSRFLKDYFLGDLASFLDQVNFRDRMCYDKVLFFLWSMDIFNQQFLKAY